MKGDVKMTPYTIEVTPEIARAAILGGAFLGGGGGGNVWRGYRNSSTALDNNRTFRIVPLEQLHPDDIVVTAATIGYYSQGGIHQNPERAVRLLNLYKNCFHQNIAGIIPNQLGGESITNGWILSAMTGIPIVDAPPNGRSFPSAKMGNMGLDEDEAFVSQQAAIGGSNESKMSITVRGTLTTTAHLIRSAAIEAKEAIHVLRNGVPVSYLKKNAAPGAIRQAIKIGMIFLENKGKPYNIFGALAENFASSILACGPVRHISSDDVSGHRLGRLYVGDTTVTFLNEFMTVDYKGVRLATFPDLIAVLDADNGRIQTISSIKEGNRILVIKVPYQNLKLSKKLFHRDAFIEVEEIIGKYLMYYVF